MKISFYGNFLVEFSCEETQRLSFMQLILKEYKHVLCKHRDTEPIKKYKNKDLIW